VRAKGALPRLPWASLGARLPYVRHVIWPVWRGSCTATYSSRPKVAQLRSAPRR